MTRSMKVIALALLVGCASTPPPKPIKKPWGMCPTGPGPIAVEAPPPPIDAMVRSHLGTGARCAARGDKGVWCWGKDEILFGDTEAHVPTLVKEYGFVDYVTNGSPSCSVRGGDVMCLAHADKQHRRGPWMARKLGDALDVASGGDSVCATHRSGPIECWGDGYREAITLPEDAISIAMGAHGQTCVARKNGVVTCWAEMEDYAYKTTTNVDGIEDAVGIAVSTQRPGFACALRRTGEVACWGQAGYGELGKGRNGTGRPPAAIARVHNAVSVALGGHHGCVVTRDARVWCWGMNDAGQVGDGSTDNRDEPVRVAGIDDAVSVACGERHTCVERTNGVVSCWGNDREGELGTGPRRGDELSFSIAPVQITGLP